MVPKTHGAGSEDDEIKNDPSCIGSPGSIRKIEAGKEDRRDKDSEDAATNRRLAVGDLPKADRATRCPEA